MSRGPSKLSSNLNHHPRVLALVTNAPGRGLVVAAIWGFNPFPSRASLSSWVKERISVWPVVNPGVYAVASDLASDELVLVHVAELRRQLVAGANLVPVCKVFLASKDHLAMLKSLRDRYE